MKFVLSDRIELLRRLNAERTRSLGAWEYEPARRGQITTIFGRYQSGEAAGIAYTACGDEDQQNVDAEFICAIVNASDDLFAERAAMMNKMALYRDALGTIEYLVAQFADEATPANEPLSEGERAVLEALRVCRHAQREPGLANAAPERKST